MGLRRSIGVRLGVSSVADENDVRILNESVTELLSREMSSVEFVRDYVQLRFDGPCVTALTLPAVSHSDYTVTAHDAGWRDALCAQIGQAVEGVSATRERLKISFSDGSALAISLLAEDYVGPEALSYVTEGGRCVVL